MNKIIIAYLSTYVYNITMNTNIIKMKSLNLMVSGLIVILSTIACEKDKGLETYISGTGHANEVIFDNGSQRSHRVTLDNFTKDAFDIREYFYNNRDDSLYYWLTFKYAAFATDCREVDEGMVVFPNSRKSPCWWPDNLKWSFFRIGPSKYKFYRCRAGYAGYGLSFFEYFAIDNAIHTGYYWKTMLEDTYKNSIKYYYYEWEDIPGL
ncbi:MAG: hypothetical protein L7F77_09395 [Candidatus Magnetominusculus sp. LBB02]|nr:hypothetical protein [Candidatus Magnetominusculus sp. LBB02]